MLTQIIIKNLAIVDSVSLDFGSGLTTLTGETGAGKSILIDALGLALGNKADAAMVRKDCARADIHAVFDVSTLITVRQWLDTQELLDTDNPHTCLLHRSINRNGRSRAFINDQPVTLQTLRALGEQLVNIHSQHAQQQLLQGKMQAFLLDAYAGLSSLRMQVNQTWQHWRDLKATQQTLQQQLAEQQQLQSLLHYQLQELKAFAPQAEELQHLESEYKKLNHSQDIVNRLQQILQRLGGDDLYETANARDLLAACCSDSGEVLAYDPQLHALDQLLNQAQVLVEEAIADTRAAMQDVELDPQTMQQLEQRISAYYDLGRKHQCEVSELAMRQEDIAAQLEQFSQQQDQQHSLETEIAEQYQRYFELAGALSKQRRKAAQDLSHAVKQHIQELGMAQADFTVQVDTPDDALPQKDGLDQIAFMVKTNPGQAMQPLNKIASGGELARIALAIQVETARFARVPSVVFDEVDIGVGGKIADMIGAKLALVARQIQVLCITHQAQVAAYGCRHFRVEKNQTRQQTRSHIEQLDHNQRVAELSRMLAGADITETTRQHAKELLDHARQWDKQKQGQAKR